MSMNKNSRQYLGGSPPPPTNGGAESPSAPSGGGGGGQRSGGKKRQTPVNDNPSPSAGHTPIGNNSMGATPRGAFSGTTPRPNSRTGLSKANAAAAGPVPTTCDSPSAGGGGKQPQGLGTPQRSIDLGGSLGNGTTLSGLMGSGNGNSAFQKNHSGVGAHHPATQQHTQQHQHTQPQPQSTTPDTMMDEFDLLLTEENLHGGGGGHGFTAVGSLIGNGPVLTDFHGKLVAEKMVKPLAKPPVLQQIPALSQPAATRHGAINPVGAGGESPCGQFPSHPNTPGLRPMSRAPAASVCNFCGSSVCSGQCPGAREYSPLIIAALQSQRVASMSNNGSPALFSGGGSRLLHSPNGDRPRSTGGENNGRHSVGDERITPRNGTNNGGSIKRGGTSYVDPTASGGFAPASSGKSTNKVHGSSNVTTSRVPQQQQQQHTHSSSSHHHGGSSHHGGYGGGPAVFSDTMSNKSAAGNSKLQRPTVTKAPSDSSATASSIHSCKTQPALATLASDLGGGVGSRQATSAGVRRNQRRILRSHTGSAFSDTRSNLSVPSPTKSSQHGGGGGLSHPAIEAAKAAGKY